jgi:glycosyltransferase involved in cell wall biosynthesis
LADRKGWRIAQEVCKKLNQRLVVAGPGDFSGYGEYVGVVDYEERGKLLSKARAVFMPSLYLEPFGSVHVEAMLCGTPAITTDWGVFTETIVNGFNGYRCRMFSEFVEATQKVDKLDYKAIRKDAISKYSTQVVAKQYENYFKRLSTLWGKGFYA